MGYTKYNFDIYQGSTTKPVFTFYSIDDDENKTYADLTDSTFILSVKKNVSSELVDKLTTENSRIKTGIVDDEGTFSETSTKPTSIQVIFPHNKTLEYTAPNYVYDLFKITDDEYELLLTGVINVERSVTYGK